ncbi:MAG: hypothetical protein MJ250_09410 [Alphaproteobacteria bacterium]|nr:hypothetical protein [Alphaproteobacteria bacterium]
MITLDQAKERYIFFKEKPKNKIWRVYFIDEIGRPAVSFDKKKILSLFADYPNNFTPEEKKLFDKEFPFWADFFSDRK